MHRETCNGERGMEELEITTTIVVDDSSFKDVIRNMEELLTELREISLMFNNCNDTVSSQRLRVPCPMEEQSED